MGMEKFAEIVQAKSGGKIKVNLFPGGVLGGDAPVVSALQGRHDRDGLDELAASWPAR
jgi:TRAP-type C4-dicarboxylate transport system substrate-binding protein